MLPIIRIEREIEVVAKRKGIMTEQMKQALDKAAKGQQWANGQMLIDRETLKPANPATTHFERLMNIPVPDKIETAVLFGANWYRNNVWHSANEKPDSKYNSEYIVQMKEGYYRISYGYDARLFHNSIQWAYIEDLLPTEGYKEK